MKRLASCLERLEFTHSKFQSYMCWMLAVGALFAIIPPVIFNMCEQGMLGCPSNGQGGCIGESFVVFGHYSTYEWLHVEFEKFKQENYDFGFEVCYNLWLQDSSLAENSEPTVWIPETFTWIDIAEEDLKLSTQDPQAKLVANRATDCTPVTNIPFGIITWKKYADFLSPNQEPIPFTDITDLAEQGWDSFSDGAITDVDGLYIAHGHPNVTSGGLLGVLTAFNRMDNVSAGGIYKFADLDSCTVSSTSVNTTISTRDHHPPHLTINTTVTNTTYPILEALSKFESRVISMAPIDYTLATMMKERGPEYLHMAFGFENDVAVMNNKSGENLIAKWNDTLAFVYLKETYWIQHNMCKLTAAEWYNEKIEKVAEKFIEFISTEIYYLQHFGLRPFNVTIESDSIINSDNGCNVDVVRDSALVYAFPNATVANCVQHQFMSVKKPAHITILLDVSASWLQLITSSETRWTEVIKNLILLPQILEDSTTLSLTCFFEDINSCSEVEYPNGTLAEVRAELVEYFTNHLTPKVGQTSVNLFSALSVTYKAVKELQEVSPDYHYIVLVVTEADNTENVNENIETILGEIEYSDNPLQVSIFPILYELEEEVLTQDNLGKLAARTNGQFSPATADTFGSVLREFTYYW